MDHQKAEVYTAITGDYVTLDGVAYVGDFYKKSSGILMTIPSDILMSQVIVPVEGRKTRTTDPIAQPQLNTELNENSTEYDLLPVLYNDPPIIISAMSEASEPKIQPSAAAGTLPPGKYMYQFPDGAVKVHTGTKLKLQVNAQQPPIFNVENGQLEIIDPKVGLNYIWLVDGERVPKEEVVDSLRSSRVVEKNRLTITNMIPKFAGNYTCLVSNDIGSSEGGSVTLEVYNSDVDSLFYTNLIKNPNGILEDGSLGTIGWEQLQGTMMPKQFTKKTIGSRDKKIEINQMAPIFHWTQEMMSPRPYQINGGILQNNPLKELKSYFTRDKYQYALNGGSTSTQMYQDIELGDLTDHIKGSIYGVSGVSAVVSFYIGNALWTYEPAYPKLTPPDAIKPSNYNQGASRISLENFAEMGPGFVHEKVTVTVEEYRNNQIIPRLGPGKDTTVVRDPWIDNLYSHYGEKYYPGDRGHLAAPDAASQGDYVDRVLFTADELMPEQNDRYTYGQYAEFKKIIIPKLNPKTNKIRLIFSIEAGTSLSGIINSIGGWEAKTSSDGLYYLKDWTMSWTSGTMNPKIKGVKWNDIRKPWTYLRENYRIQEPWPESLELRVPKQSTSRGLATGFNVTLVPDESDRGVDNSDNIKSIQSLNTSVKGLVPTPIDQELATIVFDPDDSGERNLDVVFGMNGKGVMGIRVLSSREGQADKFRRVLPWQGGLFPFAYNSPTTYLSFWPLRIQDISTDTKITIPPEKLGAVPTTTGYLLPPYLNTFPTETAWSYTQLTEGLLDNGDVNTAPS